MPAARKELRLRSCVKASPYWVIVIAALTLISYWPAFTSEFLVWDDDVYVLDNPYLHSLSAGNILRMFSSYYNGNYHPLTMLSYAIDYAVAGATPFVFHLVNVLFHLVNVFLVFAFVRGLLGSARTEPESGAAGLISLLTAALFGLHPLHVESVSWISERKDVLYVFFYLCGLLAYLRYVSKPSRARYAAVLVLFALSLLSKGMAVSFPLILVAVDFLLKRKPLSRGAMAEKLPFFGLSLLFGILAIYVQKAEHAVIAVPFLNWWDKVSFASCSLLQYAGKLLVPYRLSHYYPYPPKIGGSFPAIYSTCPFVLAAVIAAGVWAARGWRVVLFGAAFFLATIGFTLKLIPVGETVMADRYTYLSSVGLHLACAVLLVRLLERLPRYRKVVCLFLGAYLLVLGVMTFQRAKVWSTTLSLWSDASRKYPDDVEILLNRGLAYKARGDREKALRDYLQCLERAPGFERAHNNIGVMRLEDGDPHSALREFETAVRLNPRSGEGYNNRGKVKMDLGRYGEAIEDFNRALMLSPRYVASLHNRGVAKYYANDFEAALEDLNLALAYNPAYALSYYVRGLCYVGLGNVSRACLEFHRADDLGLRAARAEIEVYCR